MNMYFKKFKLVPADDTAVSFSTQQYLPIKPMPNESVMQHAVRNVLLDESMSDRNKLQMLQNTMMLQKDLKPDSHGISAAPAQAYQPGAAPATDPNRSMIPRMHLTDVMEEVVPYEKPSSSTPMRDDIFGSPFVRTKYKPRNLMNLLPYFGKQTGKGSARHKVGCLCPICKWRCARKYKRHPADVHIKPGSANYYIY